MLKETRLFIDSLPRLTFTLKPTPFHKLENLSRELEINLWCKRDDQTGFAFGGNKTRKLDFLVANALEKKADTLVTAGSAQSNFCRMAAAAGASQKMDVHLVLEGKEIQPETGNLLLDKLFGAHVHFVEDADWDAAEKEADAVARRLKQWGKSPYLMPVGGSVPLGVIGYIDGFLEMMEDFKKQKVKPDYIYHATGSGSTQAGLVMGQMIAKWDTSIHGVSVSRPAGQQTEKVNQLIGETLNFMKINFSGDYPTLINDKHVGSGYGKKTDEAESAIKLFAQKEGVMLDSYYSGKAAAGLIADIKSGAIAKGATVCFLHTGGNIQLFE